MRILAVLSFLLLGCQPRTELMIGLATDIRAPDLLDSVQLTVTRVRDGMPEEQLPPWTLSGLRDVPFNLPGSYGVYSPDGSEQKLEIELVGYKNGAAQVTRDAVVSLVPGKTLFLRLGLTAGCKNRTDCAPTESCVEGVCKAKEIDTTVLPDFRDELVSTLTCMPGATYINTEDGSPMPLSSDAASCATGCAEGTCLSPPQAPSGTCNPAGGWTVTVSCDNNCNSGLNPVGPASFDSSGQFSPQMPQCTTKFDPPTCTDQIDCQVMHNGATGHYSGPVQFSGDTFSGSLTGFATNPDGSNCNFTCKVAGVRNSGSGGSSGGGGGSGGAGPTTCNPSGTYSFQPSCQASAGCTVPQDVPSLATIGPDGLPTNWQPQPGCGFHFDPTSCSTAFNCTDGSGTMSWSSATGVEDGQFMMGTQPCSFHCMFTILKQAP